MNIQKVTFKREIHQTIPPTKCAREEENWYA